MEIKAALVKELRDKTGVGMMDCKTALKESNGNIEKSIEYLRKKGIAKAEKKSVRTANEGIIEAYIHPGNRLGVIVEINCETDFVARTDEFCGFAKDVAMQVAATMPAVVKREDLDSSIIEKELDIYRTQAIEEGKPDHIVDKIAQGKLEKYYQETVLLEQIFIKDSDKTLKDLQTDLISKLGENIQITRFNRYQLGEK